MNIVKFKEEFVTIEYLYYVIELVEGMDLFKYVSENDYLGEEEAGFIMSEILLAVKYLNNVGIVHRDLKPENIMLKIDKNKPNARASEVKIIDFGFAIYVREAGVSVKGCGTYNYVAPEVFSQKPYTFKTDIFSLGVILYFMLKGELPFNHPIREIVVKNILKGTFNVDMAVDEHFMNISEDAKDLIKKMLITKSVDRIDIDSTLEHPWIVKHRRRKNSSQVNGGQMNNKLDSPRDSLEVNHSILKAEASAFKKTENKENAKIS